MTSPWKARTELASFPLDISNLSYLFHINFSTSVTSYVSLQFITIHYICSYRIGLISGSSLHSSELGSVEAIVCSLQPVTGER